MSNRPKCVLMVLMAGLAACDEANDPAHVARQIERPVGADLEVPSPPAPTTQPDPQMLARIETLARDFLAAVRSGESQRAAEFLPSRQEFEQLFRGQNLASRYDEWREVFLASVRENEPILRQASIEKLGPANTLVTAAYPQGASLADLTFARQTSAVHDVLVQLKVDEGQRWLKLPILVLIDDHWRMLQPIQITNAPEGDVAPQRP